MRNSTAFTPSIPLGSATIQPIRLISPRKRTTELSLSTPPSKPKTQSQSRNGKRVPTYRKLQERHRSGPSAFRKAQEVPPATIITKGDVSLSTISPLGSPSTAQIEQEKKKSRVRRRENSIPLNQVKVGQCFDAVVHNTVPFGAYVDIGAVRDGLVHIRDLSVDFVHEVEDWVQPGDRVVVWVKYVDAAANVLGLTMVRPAFGFEGRTKISSVNINGRHHGVIQRVTNFGVYVDIGAERMAFLHVSAMWGTSPWRTLGQLRLGQKVWVHIDDVDETTSHIRLIARGLGGRPLTKDGAVGSPVAMKVPHSYSSSRRTHSQLLGLSEEYNDDNDDDVYGVLDNDGDDDVEEQDDDGEKDDDHTIISKEDDDDEFAFADEMGDTGSTTTNMTNVADMIDSDTEYLGLDPKDIEKLQKLKVSLEETE